MRHEIDQLFGSKYRIDNIRANFYREEPRNPSGYQEPPPKGQAFIKMHTSRFYPDPYDHLQIIQKLNA